MANIQKGTKEPFFSLESNLVKHSYCLLCIYKMKKKKLQRNILICLVKAEKVLLIGSFVL